MSSPMIYFNDELTRYTSEELTHKIDASTWSISQMYDHLLLVSHEYLDEVEACAQVTEQTPQDKTEFGAYIFSHEAFPPIDIRLPDAMNEDPLQTDEPAVLQARMSDLMTRFDALRIIATTTDPTKRTLHPGMGWLNANEWYQLILYHMNHHRRQKSRLEQAL